VCVYVCVCVYGRNEQDKKGCSCVVKEDRQTSQALITVSFRPIRKTRLY